MKKIQIFDTTLRDGEQTAGVSFNLQEKVQMAQQLEKLGVDVMEAGFPIASPGDFECVRTIAQTVKNSSVTGLARCVEADIQRAYDAVKVGVSPQIHTFLATSPIHREFKLKMSQAEVLASIEHHVHYAKQFVDMVQFSPEDATRTEPEFLVRAIQTAINAGARVINVPDTVGFTNPKEFGELFAYLRTEVQGFEDVIFSSHCHDDLGMSVANSLAAIENGASRIECTINGIGERAGNTALEEIAVALHIRKDHYQAETNIVLNQLKQTSDLVSRMSGMAVPRNKAIIGGNAYAHQSGIHQDGFLKNPSTYEIITPELVGVSKSSLVLGKLSGRHALFTRLEEIGFLIEPAEQSAIFSRFKQLADVKKEVSDDDLRAMMSGHLYQDEDFCQLKSLDVHYNSATQQLAEVTITTETGVDIKGSATGAGSIEAVYNVIDQLMGEEVTLTDYRIQSITPGMDAQAEVHALISATDGSTYHGVGIDHDVLNASARAYLQAFSKRRIATKKSKSEVEA